MTVEVTFIAYDVYQQEGENLFSNTQEVLVLQFLILIIIPHVLARSRRKIMSAFTTHTHTVLYLTKAYFCSFKFFESCSKADHVVCNIKPKFISRALLHALHKMIYTIRSNIFGEIMKR